MARLIFLVPRAGMVDVRQPVKCKRAISFKSSQIDPPVHRRDQPRILHNRPRAHRIHKPAAAGNHLYGGVK